MIFFIIVYNIIYVNLTANDFSQTCKNGVLSVVYVAITGEYGIMIWKQQNLKNLMNAVKSDYIMANKLPEREQKIILEYALNGQYVCKQWLVMSVIGSVVFPVRNIVLTLWYWAVNEEFALIPLYDLVYPDFIEDRIENIFVYTIVYIAMSGYACYSGLMYCTFVPLGPIFLLHACGQLEVVKSRIEGVFASDDLEEVKQKLKNIVKQLQYIYKYVAMSNTIFLNVGYSCSRHNSVYFYVGSFVEEIKTSFAVAYEMTLKTTTIILPITCYEVIEVTQIFIIYFVEPSRRLYVNPGYNIHSYQISSQFIHTNIHTYS